MTYVFYSASPNAARQSGDPPGREMNVRFLRRSAPSRRQFGSGSGMGVPIGRLAGRMALSRDGERTLGEAVSTDEAVLILGAPIRVKVN